MLKLLLLSCISVVTAIAANIYTFDVPSPTTTTDSSGNGHGGVGVDVGTDSPHAVLGAPRSSGLGGALLPGIGRSGHGVPRAILVVLAGAGGFAFSRNAFRFFAPYSDGL